LVAPDERDAVSVSTYGTGELIAAAIAHGAKTVYVAVGGSATTDGGAGAIRAIAERGGLREARLVVLCDVRTPFELAPSTFAPQKGASAEQVRTLERRLDRLAAELPRDPRGVPMTGAAGGLAGGLWAQFDAELVGGAAFVLAAVDYDARMRAARAVVTGEGRLDRQSLVGKVVSEVATRARQAGVPCHAVVGSNTLELFDLRILDLQLVLEATTLAKLEAAGAELGAAIRAETARGA
jgi:glycerate 2-kinase